MAVGAPAAVTGYVLNAPSTWVYQAYGFDDGSGFAKARPAWVSELFDAIVPAAYAASGEVVEPEVMTFPVLS